MEHNMKNIITLLCKKKRNKNKTKTKRNETKRKQTKQHEKKSILVTMVKTSHIGKHEICFISILRLKDIYFISLAYIIIKKIHL